jgi:ATP-dependent Clp protease ATP-binding subunit ClpA
VVDKLLVEAEAQLEQKRVSISVDEPARRWIAKRGYDPKMGARPMARIIQEFIKRPLAEELLFGKLVNGGHVEVTLSEDGEKLKLDARAADEPALLTHENES